MTFTLSKEIQREILGLCVQHLNTKIAHVKRFNSDIKTLQIIAFGGGWYALQNNTNSVLKKQGGEITFTLSIMMNKSDER